MLSNFAVWIAGAFSASPYYATNLGGLIACYTEALPFWGRTLAGDLFYSAALFGLYALLSRRLSHQQATA